MNIEKRLASVLAMSFASLTASADVVTWSGAAQAVSANASIEALHVTGATTVTIAPGCSLTVDELVGDAAITKAGAGTLIVKNFSANTAITATEGSVRFAAGGPTDTAAFDTANTFYHVDASAASSLTTSGTDAEGRTLVSALADIRGAGYPTSSSAGGNMPWIDGGALNGRDVLDFGSFAYGTAIAGYGASLSWSAASTDVREVLLVYSDALESQNQFLLCAPNAYHYHRGEAGALFNGTYSSASVRNGAIYVDGETRTASYVLPAGFHVIRLVQAGVTTASAFANDRALARGGMRLAEAIVLNANLDAVSSRRLEMRLQGKWLPEARTLASLTLTGTANLTVDEGVKFRVLGGSLAETATVSGVGEAQFQVSEGLYSYPAKSIAKVTGSAHAIRATAARRVRVEAGRLHILTSAEKLTPALHLDAAADDSFTLSGNNVYYWNDVRGYTFGQARQYTAAQEPERVAKAQNGLPVVDFGDLYLNPGRWLAANAPRNMAMAAEVSNIFDVFMVVADTDDARQYVTANNLTGQFLLGHGSAYDFHRAGLGLLLTQSYGCGKDPGTTTELDGASCMKDAVLPEGFHLVRISPQNAVKFNQLCKERSGSMWGGLKYGEILVYKGAKLSDAEAADVSSYLLNKWGLPNANGKGVAYESVSVEKGAEFVPPALSSTAALAGAGTVVGDFALAEGGMLTSVAGSSLTVTGKLTLPATGTVEIAGDPNAYSPNDVITLIAAGSVEASANLKWTATGSLTASRHRIRVFADVEGLKARIVAASMTVIVR
ncbi:MAG: hypothetical protein Q4G65_01830 [bacterium]|nr:hypothetical protein [bacterium]